MKVEAHIKRQMVRIFAYECNSSNTYVLDVTFDTLLWDFQAHIIITSWSYTFWPIPSKLAVLMKIGGSWKLSSTEQKNILVESEYMEKVSNFKITVKEFNNEKKNAVIEFNKKKREYLYISHFLYF